MLQRVQAEVGHVGRFGMAEDAEDAAFVFELVEHDLRVGPLPARSGDRRSDSRIASISSRYATRFAKYRSIAVDHARSASSTGTSTAIRPPTAIRSRLPPVRPIDAGRHAAAAARCQHRRAGRRAAVETTTRDADSPKSAAASFDARRASTRARRRATPRRRRRRCRSSTRRA